jgi:hypothetical protein
VSDNERPPVELEVPDEWGEPVPLPVDPSELAPPFPLYTFPEPAQQVALTVAAHAQAPIDLAACNMLGIVSAATIGKARLEPQPGLYEELPLWLAPALPSGERKTTTQRALMRSVYAVQSERMEAIRSALVDAEAEVSMAEKEVKAVQKKEALTREELASAMRALDAAKAAVPHSGRIVADDLTPEGLLNLFGAAEQLFVAASEGGLLDTLTGIRYGVIPNLDLLNKSHDGDPHSPARATRDIGMVQRPLLAMAVSPQPDVLRELVENTTFARRGTLARFLFALPTSLVGSREATTTPLNREVMAWWSSLVTSLFAVPVDDDVFVKVLPPAHSVFVPWRKALELRARGDIDSRLRAFRSRLHGEVYRLGGALHFLEHGAVGCRRQIGKSTAEAATELGSYFERHAELVYELLSESEQMRQVRIVHEWLELRAEDGELPRTTVRDVYRSHNRWGIEEVRKALRGLEDRALYRVERIPPGEKGGRPSEIVLRNPNLGKRLPELSKPRIPVPVLAVLADETQGFENFCCAPDCMEIGGKVEGQAELYCIAHAVFYGLTPTEAPASEER